MKVVPFLERFRTQQRHLLRANLVTLLRLHLLIVGVKRLHLPYPENVVLTASRHELPVFAEFNDPNGRVIILKLYGLLKGQIVEILVSLLICFCSHPVIRHLSRNTWCIPTSCLSPLPGRLLLTWMPWMVIFPITFQRARWPNLLLNLPLFILSSPRGAVVGLPSISLNLLRNLKLKICGLWMTARHRMLVISSGKFRLMRNYLVLVAMERPSGAL